MLLLYNMLLRDLCGAMARGCRPECGHAKHHFYSVCDVVNRENKGGTGGNVEQTVGWWNFLWWGGAGAQQLVEACSGCAQTGMFLHSMGQGVLVPWDQVGIQVTCNVGDK